MNHELRIKNTKNNQGLDFVATWVSRIFSPLILIPGFLLWFLNDAYGTKDQILGGLVVFGAGVFPILLTLVIMKMTRQISDWNIAIRKERLKFNLFALLFGGITCLLLWKFSFGSLAAYSTAFLIGVVLFTLITLYWKISAHTIVIAYVSGLMTSLSSRDTTWLWMLILLVGWARVHKKQHTPAQAVAGMLFGIMLIWITTIIDRFFIRRI